MPMAGKAYRPTIIMIAVLGSVVCGAIIWASW